MNKRTVIAILSGILAAGVVCLIVGLCVYLTSKSNAISLILGLFALITGGIMAAAAGIGLAIVGIAHLITKLNDKSEK